MAQSRNLVPISLENPVHAGAETSPARLPQQTVCISPLVIQIILVRFFPFFRMRPLSQYALQMRVNYPLMCLPARIMHHPLLSPACIPVCLPLISPNE